MRAITVRPPWSWAIVHANKRVENRSQEFAYRGELAIHSGLTYAHGAERDDVLSKAFNGHLSPDSPRLVYGAVVAVTTLLHCHIARDRCCDSPWAQYAPKDSERVVTHLVLGQVFRLRNPVPARGALGLWKPDPELIFDIDLERQAA